MNAETMNLKESRIYKETGSISHVDIMEYFEEYYLVMKFTPGTLQDKATLTKDRGEIRYFKSLDTACKIARELSRDIRLKII